MDEPLPIAQLVALLGISDHVIRRTIHAYKLEPAAIIPRNGIHPKCGLYLPSVIKEHSAMYTVQAMENWRTKQRARAGTPRVKSAVAPLELEDQIAALRQKGMKVTAIARRLRLDIAKVLEVVNRMERT